MENFVYSNFNCCPLVWNFTKAINKIKSVQKRAVRFLFDDYESSYDTPLMKAKKPTMTVQRHRYLCSEMYRTVNGLNPSFMKNVFKNQILYGRNERNTKIISLCPDQIITNLVQKVLLLVDEQLGILFLLILGPQKRLKCLKKLIKTWDRKMCKCSMCTYKNH